MQDTEILQQVFAFLDAGVSPFHAVQTAARLLEQAGYRHLEEAAYWNLEPGKGYYTTRNHSSIVAWRIPQHAIGGWRIVASHSDSPTWRIKNYAVAAPGNTIKLPTEGYGGMIMSSWLDRPLTVAGRAVVRTEEGIESKPVYLDRDLCVIPSLAIHMDRTVNDGHKWNPQIDLQPLLGMAGTTGLKTLLAAELGCREEDLLDADLTLATRQKATRIGTEGELFLSPRIDNLECACTTLLGFLAGAEDCDSACAPVWAMFDNEEVGSSSRQGAQSTFLRDVLDRILEAIPHAAQGQQRAFANSFFLSADNGHAVHPNHPERHDPANITTLGGGILIKTNATQKYTSNALSSALFEEVCRKAGVPTQRFYNRADSKGGSTLGNLQNHTIPVVTVDIGLPQLAMHSAVETAACADAISMAKAVEAFFRIHLRAMGDGRYLT